MVKTLDLRTVQDAIKIGQVSYTANFLVILSKAGLKLKSAHHLGQFYSAPKS